jgi:hypothetical protein
MRALQATIPVWGPKTVWHVSDNLYQQARGAFLAFNPNFDLDAPPDIATKQLSQIHAQIMGFP